MDSPRRVRRRRAGTRPERRRSCGDFRRHVSSNPGIQAGSVPFHSGRRRSRGCATGIVAGRIDAANRAAAATACRQRRRQYDCDKNRFDSSAACQRRAPGRDVLPKRSDRFEFDARRHLVPIPSGRKGHDIWRRPTRHKELEAIRRQRQDG